VIAAIAIPNLLSAKQAGNQASAVASLRALTSAEQLYFNNYNTYSPTLAALGPPAAGTPASATNADLVDSVLSGISPTSTATPSKAGYVFTYTPSAATNTNAYAIQAEPAAGSPTGALHYCADTSGVIRSSATTITVGTAPAVACDSTQSPI